MDKCSLGLSSRADFVRIQVTLYSFSNQRSIPRGLVVGVSLFTIYVIPIASTLYKYPHIKYPLYAFDLQIYTSFTRNVDNHCTQIFNIQLLFRSSDLVL